MKLGNPLKIFCLPLFVVLALLIWKVPNSMAAITMVCQGLNTTSLGTENGNVLGPTGVVSWGYYSAGVSRALFETYTSSTQFLSNWVQMSSTTPSFEGFSGMFSTAFTLPDGDNSLLNKQLYLLIGNGSSISTSTQLGVVTSNAWTVVNNPTVPPPVNQPCDIASATSFLWGSYHNSGGAYPSDGVVNEFRLQTVVPEPSTGALMMIGAAGLVALRRLRKV